MLRAEDVVLPMKVGQYWAVLKPLSLIKVLGIISSPHEETYTKVWGSIIEEWTCVGVPHYYPNNCLLLNWKFYVKPRGNHRTGEVRIGGRVSHEGWLFFMLVEGGRTFMLADWYCEEDYDGSKLYLEGPEDPENLPSTRLTRILNQQG